MTLSAEADSRIGRRVFNENSCFYRSCKSCEVIYVFGVHMCRMATSVLRLYREIYSLVDIAYSHYREYGHHKFVLYKRVLEIGLADYTSYI
jgi:hypothetical protein